VNRWADWRLRALRADGSKEYRVPRGGLFELVANPNYLGELIEWVGFALVCWNWAAFVWVGFCASTFVPRARHNLTFLRERFPDYPRSIRALIPFFY
jgi:protein-S-isoprenylcysteine O-methyltransferase Ste14